MSKLEDIRYAILILQNEIYNIDNILKQGHLLVNGTEELERERKSLQVAIYELMNRISDER